MSGEGPRPSLPCPGVAFPPGFPARLERVAVRLAAHRERSEGRGRAALAGAGEEFVGHRPYRAGEDLRRLDWDVLARLDRPFVRVQRREASERWTLGLDTSASMGVGPPGKLQAAAELVAGLGAVGLRTGARVRLVAAGRRPLELTRPADLGALLGFLGTLRADGGVPGPETGAGAETGAGSDDGAGDAEGRGLGALLRGAPVPSDTDRLVLVGDLLDLEPAAVARLRRPGRELLLAQVLAPVELEPPDDGSVRWLDPEGGGERDQRLDPAARSAYARALEELLERWSRAAARHGFAWRMRSSAVPFEDWLPTLLLGEGR